MYFASIFKSVMPWAGLPYYDLEVDIPVDYVEDYTLQERIGTAGRQQQQQLQNKKVPDNFSSLPRNGNGEEVIHSLIIWDFVNCI